MSFKMFQSHARTVKTLNAADVESAPRSGEAWPLSHEEVTVHLYSGILSLSAGWLMGVPLWDVIILNKPGRIVAWHKYEPFNRGIFNGSRRMRRPSNWANGRLTMLPDHSAAIYSLGAAWAQQRKNNSSLQSFCCNGPSKSSALLPTS